MDFDTKQKLINLLQDIFNHSLMVANTEADQEYILSRIEHFASKALDLVEEIPAQD